MCLFSGEDPACEMVPSGGRCKSWFWISKLGNFFELQSLNCLFHFEDFNLMLSIGRFLFEGFNLNQVCDNLSVTKIEEKFKWEVLRQFGKLSVKLFEEVVFRKRKHAKVWPITVSLFVERQEGTCWGRCFGEDNLPLN